jgi:hypothetical protein
MKLNAAYTAESMRDVGEHLRSLAETERAKNELTHKKTQHELNEARAQGYEAAAAIVEATTIVEPSKTTQATSPAERIEAALKKAA